MDEYRGLDKTYLTFCESYRSVASGFCLIFPNSKNFGNFSTNARGLVLFRKSVQRNITLRFLIFLIKLLLTGMSWAFACKTIGAHQEQLTRMASAEIGSLIYLGKFELS